MANSLDKDDKREKLQHQTLRRKTNNDILCVLYKSLVLIELCLSYEY